VRQYFQRFSASVRPSTSIRVTKVSPANSIHCQSGSEHLNHSCVGRFRKLLFSPPAPDTVRERQETYGGVAPVNLLAPHPGEGHDPPVGWPGTPSSPRGSCRTDGSKDTTKMILADRRPDTDRGTFDANLDDAACCGFRVAVSPPCGASRTTARERSRSVATLPECSPSGSAHLQQLETSITGHMRRHRNSHVI